MTIVQPMTAARSGTAEPGYMSGFGNGSRPRRCPARCRSAAIRRSSAPTASMPSSFAARPSPRRARPTSGPGCTASARPCAHWGAFRKVDAGLWRTAPCAEVEMPIAPLRWDPIPIPTRRAVLPQGVRTITTAGDAATQAGMAAHVYLDHPVDAGRVLLQRRRRDAVRPAAGRAAAVDRVRHHRRRAGRDRRHPARCEVPGRADGRPGPRLHLRELRRRLHPARARPDRRQLPGQSARFPDPGGGLRGPGRAVEDVREVGRHAVGDRARRTRRSTSSPGTATTRPYKYDLRRYSPVGSAAVRPRRPVDLHRADLAVARRPAPPTSTSWSSRIAGWWPRTPSGRPGTT